MNLSHDPTTDTLTLTLNVPADKPKNITVEWVDVLPGLRVQVGTPHITKNVVDAELYIQRNTVIYAIEIDRISERNTGDGISRFLDTVWQLDTLRAEVTDAAQRSIDTDPRLATQILKLARTSEQRQHDAEREAREQLGPRLGAAVDPDGENFQAFVRRDD